MAEFSPSELDQIEDLLEGLEGLEGLDTLELPDAARERLGEYRDILALSREALPMEDPDPGLLAGVMAEARQSAFNATATAAGVVAAAREAGSPTAVAPERPWYARWLPAMTLAATAAAVLFWVRPGDDSVSDEPAAAQPLAKADRVQSEAGDEPPGTTSTMPGAVASGGAVADTVETASESTSHEDSTEEAAPEPVESDLPDKRPASTSKARPSSKPKAEPQAAVEPLPVDKDQAWDDLTRAHGMRVRGECRSARAVYRGLEHEGLKSNVRAQALAGRGLCDEFDGNTSGAESLFSKARTLRGDIDGWIAAERQDMLANGHMRKQAPSKAKKQSPKKSKKGL